MRRLRRRGVTPQSPVGASLRADRRTLGDTLRARLSVVLSVALGLLLSACSGEPTLRGVLVDPPREIPGFTFTLPSGERFETAADGSRPTVLFFGYTNCPDVCPTTMVDWKRAKQKLGAHGDSVRYLFVTVDPERDTPAVADRYAKQFDTAFLGLSGDAATTASIMQAFGVSAAREASTDSTRYLVSHSAQTFLLDASGRLIAMYTFGMGWDVLAADLEALR